MKRPHGYVTGFTDVPHRSQHRHRKNSRACRAGVGNLFARRPRERGGAVRTWSLLGIAVLLLVACDGEQSPVQVVRSFMTAVGTFDVATAESLVCQAGRARVRESLAPFDAVPEPGEVFDVNISDLVVQEQSNDGEVAVVRVSGKLTFFFLGQQEIQEINENHIVVKEDGRWVVCDP